MENAQEKSPWKKGGRYARTLRMRGRAAQRAPPGGAALAAGSAPTPHRRIVPSTTYRVERCFWL